MRARVKLRISIKVEVPHPAGGARVLEPSLFYGFPLPFPFSNVVCGRRQLRLCFTSFSPKIS